MATTARVKWIEGMQMLGESGSGHTVVMDAAEAVGGREMGIRPMELLLIGMGGCSSIDVLSILKKGRHQVTDCVAEITAERADSQPAVFTHIQLHFTVTGQQIPEKAVQRAIDLSMESYCSASIMLGKTAKIETSFTLIEG
ncbi:OsmC family protein [Magnetococcus marinus MC-1]|uniref:OsmC family protein n=1 Tax=Magnetococcus marinus (strain ATCC BAA-1437 / JCM 17883 / MC-1) TaxID=156889 RepID=A0L507_MAGMM|nr:OsmC family protein [Magnetococcus marinus]ABK43050.1 OsmC family protein [Magnetococcus marinus MC-1]